MNYNALYLPLSDREAKLGLLFTVLFLPVCILLSRAIPASSYAIICGFYGLCCILCVILFKRFLRETILNIPFTGFQLLWKPVLAVFLNTVICTVINDIAMFYGVSYFQNTDWGPVLWNIRSASLEEAVASHGWLVLISLVLFLPIVEEMVFRGIIFGTIFQKNTFFAISVSVLIYTGFHMVQFIGTLDDPVYMALYFIQFIPQGLFLCWLYRSTDSLAAPILMHALCNFNVYMAAL